MQNGRKMNDEIVALILEYGWIDGSHHKQWLIDQILRVASGAKYEGIVSSFFENDWDEGVAP